MNHSDVERGAEDGTVIKRAYSCQTTRDLCNRGTGEWETRPDELAAFPMQATRPIQERLPPRWRPVDRWRLPGDRVLPAAQVVGGIDAVMPAGDVLRSIRVEAWQVLGRVGSMLVDA